MQNKLYNNRYMNKNLLETYKQTNSYYHFSEIVQAQTDLIKNYTKKEAYKYIEKYFKISEKEALFELDFIKKYKCNGKFVHTTSLFFLGLNLKDMIIDNLYQQSCIQDRRQTFNYIWFLSCLFHDIASAVEQNKMFLSRGNDIDLNFYLGQFNIKYDLFNYTWEKAKTYNYSKFLVQNYFKYRLEEFNCVDHGIIAGYLLYDGLRKNYDKVFEKSNSTNYEDFKYNNLYWKKTHFYYYAIASHVIIEHNIWLAENDKIQIYKKYGLEELIPNKSSQKKISITSSPLLFYFGLLDSIEPLKVFGSNNAADILQKISITYCQNNIKILWEKELESINKFKQWQDNIKNLQKWLNLNIQLNDMSIDINIS